MYITNLNVAKESTIPYDVRYTDTGCSLTAWIDLPPYMADVDIGKYQILCLYARTHDDVADYLRSTLPSLSRREVTDAVRYHTLLAGLAKQFRRDDDSIHHMMLAQGAGYELRKRDWLEEEGLNV